MTKIQICFYFAVKIINAISVYFLKEFDESSKN